MSRFALVGASCTILQLFAFYAMTGAGFPGVASFVTSFGLVAQLNFVLSDRFTWGHRRQPHLTRAGLLRRWALFNVSAGCSLAVSTAVFALVERSFGSAFAAPCGVAGSIAVSFLLGDRLVFRGPRVDDSVAVLLSAGASSEEVRAVLVPAGAGAASFDAGTDPSMYAQTVGRGISVFLPAFNEGANLPTVVGQTLSALTRIAPNHRVIIVNDGSSDDTAGVAEDLAALHDPYVHVVHHERNLGYGHALRSGFAEGLRNGSDWIGFMDADGQFDPVQFESLIARAHSTHADLVAGYRIKRADGPLRLLTGRAWHFLTRVVVGTRVRDVDCGFKLVHRNVFKRVQLGGSYAAVSPELLVRATRAGFRTAEVGVDHYPRRAGEQTGSDLKVIVRSLIGLVTLRLSLSRRATDHEPRDLPRGHRGGSAAGVALLAGLLSVSSFGFFYSRGQTLAYADGISHLLIAKRAIQGATPGLAQLGSVWLPLPHLLMAPLTASSYLFYSGIAGSIVSMVAFVVAAVMLYKTAVLMTGSMAGGWIAALIFMLNPNVLYLQSTPMTETLLFACMAAAVYQLLRWSVTDDWRYLCGCAAALFLATLTRYEGWVLLASTGIAVAFVMLRRGYSRERAQGSALFFLTMAAAGVLGWALWNRIIFGSFTDFATGRYAKPSLWVSAGDRATGHFLIAVRTYLIAVVETVGAPFVIIGALGVVAHLWEKRTRAEVVAPLTLLIMLPFFVVAIYTGQRPLHVTQISGDLYNTRFGLVMALPAALFGAQCLVVLGRWLRQVHSRRPAWLGPTAFGVSVTRARTALGVSALMLLVGTGAIGAARLSSGIVTLREPTHWHSYTASAGAAHALRVDYNGGRILMQGFGNEYVSFASRVPIDQTIYEGSYRLWPAALLNPTSSGIRWIYMTRTASDQVWQALHDSPRLRHFALVYDDGTHFIYRSLTAPAHLSAARRPTSLNHGGAR